MQTIANTTARIASALRAFLRPSAAPSFDVCAEGYGTIASYATMQQAETALHRLPPVLRRTAIICDGDGYCLYR